MASKELADKLIELGYSIKSHSSTVEDEVADEIRRNVIGTAETEVVEKRISTKGRATIIRRRSQTVRRAPETPPPAEEKEEPVTEKKATSWPSPTVSHPAIRSMSALRATKLPAMLTAGW